MKNEKTRFFENKLFRFGKVCFNRTASSWTSAQYRWFRNFWWIRHFVRWSHLPWSAPDCPERQQDSSKDSFSWKTRFWARFRCHKSANARKSSVSTMCQQYSTRWQSESQMQHSNKTCFRFGCSTAKLRAIHHSSVILFKTWKLWVHGNSKPIHHWFWILRLAHQQLLNLCNKCGPFGSQYLWSVVLWGVWTSNKRTELKKLFFTTNWL